MSKFTVTLYMEREAPTKPAWGAPCNGCGVCCLMEPCPLGVMLSGRRTGACRALRWQPDARQYRCGAITSAQEVIRARLPACVHGVVPLLAALLARVARRWVAAGTGCDCDVPSPERAPAAQVLAP
jgi:hypothetical protein